MMSSSCLLARRPPSSTAMSSLCLAMFATLSSFYGVLGLDDTRRTIYSGDQDRTPNSLHCLDLLNKCADKKKCCEELAGVCADAFECSDSFLEAKIETQREATSETVSFTSSSVCEDNPEWYRLNSRGIALRCNWVARKSDARCDRHGFVGDAADSTAAREECRATCGTCLTPEVASGDHVPPTVVLTFFAMADTPYDRIERQCLLHQLQKDYGELDPAIGASFAVHLGDIKYGPDPCNDSTYRDIRGIFEARRDETGLDTFFIIGDNEWADCDNTAHAWRHWTTNFGKDSTFGQFSSGVPQVDWLSTPSDLVGINEVTGHVENFAFFMPTDHNEGVGFISLNLVGGTTDQDDFEGYDGRNHRMQQNYDWTALKMAEFHNMGMVAAVFLGHATISSGGGRQLYGNALKDLLEGDTYQNLSVLYLHGDGHIFKFDLDDTQQFPNGNNLTSIQLDAGGYAPPLILRVFKAHNGDHFFEIDRRDGKYPSSDGNDCICKLEPDGIIDTPTIITCSESME